MQRHIELINAEDFLTIYVNGREIGSISHGISNHTEILEWMFEVVYLHGQSSGRETLRGDLAMLISSDRGEFTPSDALPVRPVPTYGTQR